MELITELRALLPCSLEGYQVGQLLAVGGASKNNTGVGRASRCWPTSPMSAQARPASAPTSSTPCTAPGFVKMLAPEGSLVFHEKAWNSYAYRRTEQRLFTSFNRQLFCWLDKWVDLSLDDIRHMEEETQELDEMKQKGAVRGLTAGDE